MKADDILDDARCFVGVPFRHQGRNPGIGIDCIGLGVLYLRRRGYTVRDRTDYGRDPDGTLRAALEGALGPAVAIGRGCQAHARPGDMLMIEWAADHPRHVAIASELYGGPALIHADNSPTIAKVCEHPIDLKWQRRIIGVWRVE